jgi:hypothetical protein
LDLTGRTTDSSRPRLVGDFTEQDEDNLVRLATLTATALDALAQLHLPDYRAKLASAAKASSDPADVGGSLE